MSRIFFGGIKHCGKTLMAGLVSGILGYDSADADELVLPLLSGMGVREFYKSKGRDEFDSLMLTAVSNYCSMNESFILSLGGGACDSEALMKTVKDNGKLIYLKRDEDEMYPYVIEHGIPAFLDPENPGLSFSSVYRRRDALYSKYADLTIHLGKYGDKEEKASIIIDKLKEAGYVR